jgi:hypothetical protein
MRQEAKFLTDLSWGAKTPKILFIAGVPSKLDIENDKILTGSDGALLRIS